MRTKVKKSRASRDCAHANTVTTVNVGLRRSVCEDCGDITLSIDTDYETTPLRGLSTERAELVT